MSIEELIDEFYISEEDAKNYIQAVKDYAALKQDVADALRNEYNLIVEPEIREISNLCHYIERGIALAFDSFALFRAKELYYKTNDFWVVRRNRIYPYSETSANIFFDDTEKPLIWDFNHLRFIVSYYEIQNSEKDTPEGAFKDSLRCILISEYKYFTNIENGFTFTNIYTQDDFIVGKTTEKELDSWDMEYDPAGRSTISDEEVIHFVRWVRGEESIEPSSLPNFNPHGLTYEEMRFLYDYDRIYSKAKEEGILNDAKIERKIAIAVIKSLDYLMDDHEIKDVTERLERWIEKSKRQIANFAQNDRLAQSTYGNTLEKECYMLQAVQKHREWIY